MIRAKWIGCSVGLVAGIALVPFNSIRMDGGFENAEYRLTFTDGDGRPMPGVKLRVLTRAGGPCHLYPVDEFIPSHAPTSDSTGRMTFHHTGRGIEFSSTESRNFLGMSFGGESPQYDCVFSLDDREVYRARYNDLRPWRGGSERPTVDRTWREPDWPWREYVAHHQEWDVHRLRLLDCNGDGQMDREERVAAHSFEWWMERAPAERKELDVRYFLVERTVLIPPK